MAGTDIYGSHQEDPSRKVLLTASCFEVIQRSILIESPNEEEAIVYLFGLTDKKTTLAILAYRPRQVASWGSFSVDRFAMGEVVRRASDLGLQVVGQVHTHPGEAFHSRGDDDGAKIRYTGYVSIVIPEFGRHLPKTNGIATYMYVAPKGFVRIPAAGFTVIPEI
jgi:proteasome lid subunit RPN8/RPN11